MVLHWNRRDDQNLLPEFGQQDRFLFVTRILSFGMFILLPRIISDLNFYKVQRAGLACHKAKRAVANLTREQIKIESTNRQYRRA